MQFEGKTVVVCGIAHPAAVALAGAFSRRRALVFVAAPAYVDSEFVAHQINESGGVAESAEVNFADVREIEDYIAELVVWTGGIDIAIVSVRGGHGGADGQLAAARVIAAHMAERGEGVVFTVSADGAPGPELASLADQMEPNGVAILPVTCGPAPGGGPVPLL